MRHLLIPGVLALTSMAALAQGPSITAVLDAGGYSANVAPGTVFVVKGSNLCATNTVGTTPYSTAAMGGATIAFTPSGGGSAVNAYMIYCYNSGGVTQLAAELPSTAAAGNYNVTVTNGATSAAFATTVVARKFQIMTQTSTGSGRALAQNVVSGTQYDLNAYTTGAVPGASFLKSPAKASEYVIAWGTGLGAATGYDATAPGGGYDFIAQQHLDVKAIVGGVTVTPSYAGRSNLFPGLDNIAFQIPANVPTGCNITLQISVAGQLSNLTTIAIAPNASATACVDPQYSPQVLSKLDSGGTVSAGYFALTSYNGSYTFSGQTYTARIEAASGAFAQYNADTITQIPNLASAANGACQVYTATTTSSGGNNTGVTSLTYLDAGAVTLNGPNVSNKAFTETNKVYSLNLGISLSGISIPISLPGFNANPVISAGTYTVSGAGGADIGPFTANITIGQPLTITGGLPATVNRSQDLPINWTGGASTDIVIIAGTSSVLASGTAQNGTYNSATFTCTTTGDKHTFTVPTAILQQLPATPSGAASGSAVGSLAVLTTSTPSSGNGLFTAPLKAGGSTDYGLFTAGIGTLATPTYQ